jgi:TRAP-type C4-dicarboxylate transport system permease small subunit
LNRFSSAYGRLLDACGAVAAFLVFAATAMVTANVLLRNAVGLRVPGDVELSEYAMLLITAFAAPWLLRQGQHVRIDLLLQKLPPSVGWLCELFCDALGFAVSVLMAWYGVRVMLASIASGTKIVKEFLIPEWWTLVPLPLMFALLAIEFVFRFQRVLSGPRLPRKEGAPL